jgi:molybdopterin synthase catalytic subunit
MSENILITGPISPAIIQNRLECFNQQPDAGGVSIFIGIVRRDNISGKEVTAIEYSAYEALVNSEAEKIYNSVMNEFPQVKQIELFHSVGRVNAGEISMAAMVSAVHRDQAMQVCKKIVDLVKVKLPIWKKEIYTDFTYHWKQDDLA